ncbi:hypothetical protein Tco_0015206 [Tanacetum coccineum]
MLPVTQIDTFYNGLTLRHRDTINAAAGLGLYEKAPLKIASLKLQMEEMNRNLTRVLQTNQQVNTITPSCETCGVPHSYNDYPATVGQNQNVYAVGAYNQGGNSYQPQVNDDIFDLEEDIIENLLNLDKTKNLPPYHDNQLSGNPTPISELETKSSSSSSLTLISLEESELIWEGEFNVISQFMISDSFPPEITSDYFLEEFAYEFAHITFTPGNDDLPFDAKSDLLELEYLLNHDPIKDMDSILEDSIDENSLNDTISKMFTDEHALDYSSPPLWDDYDDNLFDHETDNDNVYDDPFDFKEEKNQRV